MELTGKSHRYPQLDVHEISNVDTKDHRVLMSPYFQLDVSAICHKVMIKLNL